MATAEEASPRHTKKDVMCMAEVGVQAVSEQYVCCKRETREAMKG